MTATEPRSPAATRPVSGRRKLAYIAMMLAISAVVVTITHYALADHPGLSLLVTAGAGLATGWTIGNILRLPSCHH